MTDHELLEEILKSQKKNTRAQQIAMSACCVMAGILLIACIILVPRAVSLMHQAETAIAGVNELTAQMQVSLAGVDTLTQDLDILVVTNTEEVQQAVQKLNGIDFDALNQAITDLRDVVEPLAKAVNSFPFG